MRKPTVMLLLLVLVAAACGSATGRTKEIREVDAALDRARDTSHEFVYTDHTTSPEHEYVVRGVVVDDLRFTGTLEVDGKPVLTEVISDDAIAIRLLDPTVGAKLIAMASAEDKIAGEALAAGKWVLDHAGAPPLIATRTREGTVEVGGNPVLDAYYFFQYASEALTQGLGMNRFNPDSVEYNPLDDPWADDNIDRLQDAGIRRFDLGQPPLPRPNERGTRAALPSVKHFRKMSFYVKGRDVTLVREQIDFEDRSEFRRAGAGRAAEYYLELLRDAKAGATQDPVRQREMTYEVVRRGDVRPVRLPIDDVVTATVPGLAEVKIFETPSLDRPEAPPVVPVPVPAG